jgi:transposase-like protein
MPSPASPEREAFWRNLVAHREAAKLTIAEVCKEASVSPASFFYWRKKFRAAECQPNPSSGLAAPIVPVRIVDDRVAKITLETPHGIRVCVPAGCDEATLQWVMRVVMEVCRENASC